MAEVREDCEAKLEGFWITREPAQDWQLDVQWFRNQPSLAKTVKHVSLSISAGSSILKPMPTPLTRS